MMVDGRSAVGEKRRRVAALQMVLLEVLEAALPGFFRDSKCRKGLSPVSPATAALRRAAGKGRGMITLNRQPSLSGRR
ncbi:hypothetical protein BH11ARM2_BH11ARM2_06220 [soil metagenome]